MEKDFTVFKELLDLQNQNKINTALRLLFQTVDDVCIKIVKSGSDDFTKCNDFFTLPEVKEFKNDLQVGLLVITLPWKTKLLERSNYIEIVRASLLKEYSVKQTDRVLAGLI